MKLGRLIPPTLFFFKNVLAILAPLPFLINFGIILPISTKKTHWYFDRNYIKPIYEFEENCHLCCAVFQSMNKICLFIYLGLLWFLSSVLCSFQHTSPIHVLLDIQLGISFFLSNCKGYCIFNFSVYMLLAGIQKYNWVLYFYLVSCDLAKLTY